MFVTRSTCNRSCQPSLSVVITHCSHISCAVRTKWGGITFTRLKSLTCETSPSPPCSHCRLHSIGNLGHCALTPPLWYRDQQGYDNLFLMTLRWNRSLWYNFNEIKMGFFHFFVTLGIEFIRKVHIGAIVFNPRKWRFPISNKLLTIIRPGVDLPCYHKPRTLKSSFNAKEYICIHIHYNDVTIGSMASQITSPTIVDSAVYSGADQSKHQSSASLAFVRGIHRGPVNCTHKWPVTRKMFPLHDVIMTYMQLIQSH